MFRYFSPQLHMRVFACHVSIIQNSFESMWQHTLQLYLLLGQWIPAKWANTHNLDEVSLFDHLCFSPSSTMSKDSTFVMPVIAADFLIEWPFSTCSRARRIWSSLNVPILVSLCLFLTIMLRYHLEICIVHTIKECSDSSQYSAFVEYCWNTCEMSQQSTSSGSRYLLQMTIYIHNTTIIDR